MMGLRNIGSLSASLRSLSYALISAFIVLGASCGGGGGGGGGGFLPNDGNGNLTSFTLELSLVDANGNPTTTVSSTFPATLRVRVRENNFDAAAVVGEVVAANAAFAIIAPANGQALTDSEGVAEFQIQAGPRWAQIRSTSLLPALLGKKQPRSALKSSARDFS